MIEKVTYEGENQKKIERYLLTAYSVYILFLLAVPQEQKWNTWGDYLMIAGVAACWMIHIGEYGTYLFRAGFTAVMMQISLIFCAVHAEELSDVLPFLLASVICLGLYGKEEIVYIAVASTIVIFFYHEIIRGHIFETSAKGLLYTGLQLVNALLVENVVYNWTKRNRKGSKFLLGAIDELKEAESSKDDFLANVSHEIRTPINTICGISEILLQEELPQHMQVNVRNIQLAGRNLMDVVSNILDFSELQSGDMELEEEAYNIASTINDIINMAMARRNEKPIELIVDCDANLPCGLMGDEKKVRRVIMNLVDNAVKFTEEGCISIVIGFRRESYGINLIIRIKDTGIGMDETSLEKLFTSFNQVDTGRCRQESGLGLGLAIVQELVQKMGGAITIKSKKNKGTVVKFVVPQKVLDDTPIASLRDKDAINVATYIDMEQFRMAAIRDEYSANIMHMAEQLRGKCHMCRNLAELQRRVQREHFSHIFISPPEYHEDQAFFDALSEQVKVVLVLYREEEKDISNPRLLKIYKPFYILSIASVLNSEQMDEQGGVRPGKFITRNAHVLVVDDNHMNLQVIGGLLELYKIRVTKAESGSQALEKITSMDYDFVFMDHMMPEMDGVETLHRIRNKVGTYYQKVPIVALTANAVAGTREILIGEGFTDFLEKPIEKSVLERVLKRNLPPEKIITREVYEEMPVPAEDAKEKAENIRLEQEEKKTEDKEWEKELEEAGLDAGQGMVYCSGKEQYIQVLRGFLEDYPVSASQAERLFLQKEWKDYTIVVHGIKSAMKSIGAFSVSELARLQEQAGREGRTDDILERHAGLMEAYQALFTALRKLDWLQPDSVEEDADKTEETGKEALEQEQFEKRLLEMKDAAYDLDEERLLKMITELQLYTYRGISLEALMTRVKKKVEMSDYMSAVEMVMRLKKELEEKEGEEACGKESSVL
ncbi:MAG: response regulator [Lachnospiraceae bacterium]|nr:response regulator [Lachnospiraceae bacterium]